MTHAARVAVAALAWIAVAPSFACASLLGDFSTGEDGGASDAEAGAESGGSDASHDGSVEVDAAEAGTQDAGDVVCASTDLLCGGACVPSDTRNCGRCGHDCQGGSCVVGRCGAVIVAQGGMAPVGIAVDATSVYWADLDAGTVMKIAKSASGGTGTPLVTGQMQPLGVTVDASWVYWTNFGDGTVMKLAK